VIQATPIAGSKCRRVLPVNHAVVGGRDRACRFWHALAFVVIAQNGVEHERRCNHGYQRQNRDEPPLRRSFSALLRWCPHRRLLLRVYCAETMKAR
jgi:hypothetical protein